MDVLVKALGPVFAAGFAVQQLLEIIDPATSHFIKDAMWRKFTLGLISLAIGLLLSSLGGFCLLSTLFQASSSSSNWNHPVLDIIITGLVLSAGTEGFNSVMKFLGYAKENKKAEAATAKASVSNQVMGKVNREGASGTHNVSVKQEVLS